MVSFIKTTNAVDEQIDLQLAGDIGQFTYDFNGLVDYLYPWGSKDHKLDTFPYNQPKKWQRDILRAASDHRKDNYYRRALGIDMIPFRACVSSGHGIGKSALVAWLIECFMATTPDCRGVVSAMTAAQLETKTWPELAKWHNLSIVKHWFTWTASSYVYAPYPEDRKKNYMFSAVTVSEDRSEAFAGLHNLGSVVVIIFDEASGIAPILYEIADGAAAAGSEFFFFAFGNPTRPDGPFFDCFYKHGELFQVKRFIDNRDVEGTNQLAQQQIIDKYGVDDDRVKIRVYGQFPSKSYAGFISIQDINGAIQRELTHDATAPVIIGVDVARYGDDDTRITVRCGRDARSIPSLAMPYSATTEVTREVARVADKYEADAIVVEGVGPGAGVIDQLRELGYFVTEIHPNSRAEDPKRFGNIRAEFWHKLRDWIQHRGCIEDDPILYNDLSSMQYSINDKTEGRGSGLYMEAKAKMKERGLPSPDFGDSLALTFAVSPRRRTRDGTRHRPRMAISEEPHI